jgi:hypothetical protein
MRVEEITDFDHYWSEPRFARKRPNFRGSMMQAYGDNIYHRHPRTGRWVQANSFHSRPEGITNRENLDRDTSSERVLISRDFAYWGGSGPKIPARFLNFEGADVCMKGQGHKNRLPDRLVTAFVAWLRSLGAVGFQGRPHDWE